MKLQSILEDFEKGYVLTGRLIHGSSIETNEINFDTKSSAIGAFSYMVFHPVSTYRELFLG